VLLNYIFFTTDTNEIITPNYVEISNGQFGVLHGTTTGSTEEQLYTTNEYTYMANYINVPGVGTLRDGDLIKLNMFDKTFYTLHIGWYTTNDGLDLYGWYLVNNEVVRPFYKRFIDTLEIVKHTGCVCSEN
jgi:hypothetical protein